MSTFIFRLLLGAYFVVAGVLYVVCIHTTSSDVKRLQHELANVSRTKFVRMKEKKDRQQVQEQIDRMKSVVQRFSERVGRYDQQELVSRVGNLARRHQVDIGSFQMGEKKSIGPCRVYPATVRLSSTSFTDALSFLNEVEKDEGHFFWITRVSMDTTGESDLRHRVKLEMMLVANTLLQS